MSFCDELRKIEWENSYSNKKEEIIHREVEGLQALRYFHVMRQGMASEI